MRTKIHVEQEKLGLKQKNNNRVLVIKTISNQENSLSTFSHK